MPSIRSRTLRALKSWNLPAATQNSFPEKARTWTVGATYQPSWLRGLSLSVDWYSIDIEDSIGTLGGQTIVDQCYQAQIAAACNQITTVDGAFSVIRATYINFSSEHGSGMDMEADYATGLTAIHLPGDIAVQWLANYVDTWRQTPERHLFQWRDSRSIRVGARRFRRCIRWAPPRLQVERVTIQGARSR